TRSKRDWSSDVCSSDLLLHDSDPEAEERETFLKARALLETLALDDAGTPSAQEAQDPAAAEQPAREGAGAGMRVLLVDYEDSFEIGRASCRERRQIAEG